MTVFPSDVRSAEPARADDVLVGPHTAFETEPLTWTTAEGGAEDSLAEHAPAASAGNGQLPVVARISGPVVIPRLASAHNSPGRVGYPDAISSAVGMTSTGTQGTQMLGLGTFGATQPTHTTKLDEVKQQGNQIEIRATHELAIDVTTQATDDLDVTGTASAVITAGNWDDVYKDLYPNSYGKPARRRFWNLPVVQTHENLHKKQSIEATTKGVREAKTWLDTQTIAAGDWPQKEAAAKVLIAAANQRIRDYDLDDYFGSNRRDTPHDQRMGEQRVYNAGKGTYFTLVQGIRARARKLGWAGSVTPQEVAAYHKVNNHPA